MKKRIIASILFLCLSMSLIPITTSAAGNPFDDVPMNAWYYDGVQYARENGLMQGMTYTTFGPNETTTRGMIVTILHRLEGSPITSQAQFDDVGMGTYYADAVAWAASNGIVDGYGDGTFGPNNPITREQMALILFRYAQNEGYDVTGAADLSGYADASDISDCAVQAMQWANNAGLINGIDASTLAPKGSATRAEVACILYRFCTEFMPGGSGSITINGGGYGGNSGYRPTSRPTSRPTATPTPTPEDVIFDNGDEGDVANIELPGVEVKASQEGDQAVVTFTGTVTKDDLGALTECPTSDTNYDWADDVAFTYAYFRLPEGAETVDLDGQASIPYDDMIKLDGSTTDGQTVTIDGVDYYKMVIQFAHKAKGGDWELSLGADNDTKIVEYNFTVGSGYGETYEALASYKLKLDYTNLFIDTGVVFDNGDEGDVANIELPGVEVKASQEGDQAVVTFTGTVTKDDLGALTECPTSDPNYDWADDVAFTYAYFRLPDGAETVDLDGQASIPYDDMIKLDGSTTDGQTVTIGDASYYKMVIQFAHKAKGSDWALSLGADNDTKIVEYNFTVGSGYGETYEALASYKLKLDYTDLFIDTGVVYDGGDEGDVANIELPGVTVTTSQEDDKEVVTFTGTVAKDDLGALTECPTSDTNYDWADDVAFTYAYFPLPAGADTVNFGDQISVPSDDMIKLDGSTTDGQTVTIDDVQYYKMVIQFAHKAKGSDWALSLGADNDTKIVEYNFTVGRVNEDTYEALASYKLKLDYTNLFIDTGVVYGGGEAGDPDDVATIALPGVEVKTSQEGDKEVVTFTGTVAKSDLDALTECPTDDPSYDWADDVAFTYAYFRLPEGAETVNFSDQVSIPYDSMIKLDNQTTDGQTVTIDGVRYYKMAIQFAHKAKGADWALSLGADNDTNIVEYTFTVGSGYGETYNVLDTFKLKLDYTNLTIDPGAVTTDEEPQA